ncbi:MAG: hypothetical protein V4710_14885 [Verrucomicrobiota bacterium]
MQQFKPGFRFSPSDAAVLAMGSALALFARKEMAIISAMAVGHFFLFCNVFRIGRNSELIWAGIFIILSACTIAQGRPGWGMTIGLAITAAAALIFRELKTLPITAFYGARLIPACRSGGINKTTGSHLASKLPIRKANNHNNDTTHQLAALLQTESKGRSRLCGDDQPGRNLIPAQRKNFHSWRQTKSDRRY